MSITKETASNIDQACRITRGLVAMHPVQRDEFRRYEAVQAWPLIAPLYNGLEQALKALLLAQPAARVTLDDLKKPPFGHDLENLYAALPSDDRDHVELHFREHWSLHDYDTRGTHITTAEQFVAHINGTAKDGLLAWRYFLIDETVKIPATSPGTMCEIWAAICCRLNKEVFNKQDDCSRLSRMLAFKFRRLVLRPIPVPYDEFIDEINEWTVHKNGDQLAAWIDLFVKTSHNALHEVQATERLRNELAGMAHKALTDMASDSADPDEAQLLRRIQHDPNLVWEPTTATFRS